MFVNLLPVRAAQAVPMFLEFTGPMRRCRSRYEKQRLCTWTVPDHVGDRVVFVVGAVELEAILRDSAMCAEATSVFIALLSVG